MKRVQWAFWILALLALNIFFAWPDQLPEGVQVVKQATYSARGELGARVALRHMVLGENRGHYGARYDVSLPRELDVSEPLALYINVIEPLFYVTVDDRRIYSLLQSDNPHAVNNRRPHLIALPFPLDAAGKTISFHHFPHHYEGTVLDEIWVGPLAKLGPVYKKRYAVRVLSAKIMLAVYLLSAFGTLAYWYTARRFNDPLWFSIACFGLAWVTYSGLVVVEPRVSLPVLHHLTIFVVVVTAVALAQFCFEQTGLRTRPQDTALKAIILLATVCGLILYEDKIPFRYALVMDVVAVLLGIYVLIRLIRHGLRDHAIQSQALLVGAGLTLTLGAFTVGASWFFFETQIEIYVVLFAPIPLLLVMYWLMLRRFARARFRTEALNRQLQRRVEKREREILAASEQVQALVREHTVRMERDRLMRDMHDGLGAQLITSIRLAERGELSHAAMREVLSECLDEMHLAIESLKPTGDDLFAVLADYRYRIEPRLEHLGVDLSWYFEPSQRLKLTSASVMQVLRIVNEAVSNALKHSGSHHLRIAGSADQTHYTLSIIDAGKGSAHDNIDWQAPPSAGNGLRNMHHRAEAIGARLQVWLGSAGTTVAIELPLTVTPGDGCGRMVLDGQLKETREHSDWNAAGKK
jgi:signal transduction histidine kinase